MWSTIRRKSIEDNIERQFETNPKSALNWMDNNIDVNSAMNPLEGNISDNKTDEVMANNGLTIDCTQELDTLDEPIVETLLRDFRSIYTKLKYILIPMYLSDSYRNVLKDWDLWGPLIVTTFLALTLHHNEETSSGGTVVVGPHFAQVFVLIWLSNCLVSLNYKLLISCRKRNVTNIGDKSLSNTFCPTLFQLLCVFGYCLSPPSLGIIVLKLISLSTSVQIKYLFYEKLIIGIIFGFIWPTISSVRIISKYVDKDKRVLVIYPIALFYFVLSWAIITTH